MRNKVIALIIRFAQQNGIHYTEVELQKYSNDELLNILLEEHSDFIEEK